MDYYAEYHRNRHSIYKLQYHLVVVTKYRHPVLTGELANRLIQISREVIEGDWKCRILEITTDKDHVHLLFEASPQTQLSKLVNNYKTVTSRLLRKEFSSALEKYYWKDLFWSDSYFLSTVSETTEEAVSDQTGFFTPNEKIDFSNVKIEPMFEEEVDFDTFSKSDFRAVKVKACEAVKKSKKLLQFTLDDGTGTDRIILSGIHAYYEPEELVGKTLIAITNLPPRKMMGIDSCGMLLSAVNNKKDSDEEELHLLMVDNHIPAGAKLY